MMKSVVFPIVVTAAGALFAGCASSSGARSEPSTTPANAAAPEPGTGPQPTTQGQGMMGGQGRGMGGQGMGMMGGQGQGMGGQGMGMMGGDACPMQVPGTTVTATDVEGGVALEFKTTGDVAALRQRVQRMQTMHEQQAGGGMMMGSGGSTGSGTQPGQGETAAAPGQAQGGMQGGGMHMGGMQGGGMHMGGMQNGGMQNGGMMMPPATATVEDIEGGARLVLRPKDPSQLAMLREHTRMRATRMASGQCPMLSGSQPATTSAPATGGADNAATQPSR